MSQQPGVVTAVRWTDVCPWLLIVRAARVAFLVRVIVLATLGVFLTQWGWSTVEWALGVEPGPPLLEQLTEHPPTPLLRAAPPTPPFTSDPFTLVDRHPWAGPLIRGWAWMIQPLTGLIEASGWRATIALLASGVWVMAVWALVGGAIARIAALYLARGEHLGPIAALRSAAANWVSTFAAPAFCFAVIAVFVLLLAFTGLLMRWGPLAFLAGVFWPLVLAMGVAAAVFAIGLLAGWPLMWSTVAAERTDAFDAVSRGYAFTFQRPLHWVFFVLVATVLGLLAQTAVSLAVGAVASAVHGSVGWGINETTTYGQAVLNGQTPPEDAPLGLFPRAGGKMLRFWEAGLSGLATAFPLAYLFPASMAIYLLLRRLIDSTELTEISLDDNPPEAGLTSLVPDPATKVPTTTATPGASPVPSALAETIAHPPAAAATPAPPADGEPTATITELRGGST
jgi:hypothetical protein